MLGDQSTQANRRKQSPNNHVTAMEALGLSGVIFRGHLFRLLSFSAASALALLTLRLLSFS